MIKRPPSTPIPDELRDVLAEAAKSNRNYEIGHLHQEVRREIFRALGRETVDEPEHRRDRVARACALIAERIRARVAQIHPTDGSANPLWAGKDRGDTSEAMRASPRDLLKTAQEILVHLADQIAGSREKTARYDQTHVLPQHIAIDPAKLSDRFVTQLGLGHLLAPKGSTALQKLQAKVALIPQVKELLSHLQPLSTSPTAGEAGPLAVYKKSGRLFMITDGPRKGSILCAQEIAGNEHFAVMDLYKAERRIKHADKQYGEEREKLIDINGKLAEIQDQVAHHWDDAKSPEKLAPMLKTLGDAAEDLEMVSNGYKVQLLKGIRNAARLIEGKKPRPALECLDKASRMIAYRLESVPDIMKELSADGQIVAGHISKEEHTLGRLYDAVQHQKQQPRLADPEANLEDREIPAIRTRIHRLVTECTAIQFAQPNAPFAAKLTGYLAWARREMQSQKPNRQSLANAFMRAYVVSKISGFNGFLMKLYEDFSINGDSVAGVNAAVWKTQLATATEVFNTRDVNKGVPTPEYNPIWAGVRTLTGTLMAKMDEYEKGDPAQKAQAVKEVKKAINSLNIPERVASIGHETASETQV